MLPGLSGRLLEMLIDLPAEGEAGRQTAVDQLLELAQLDVGLTANVLSSAAAGGMAASTLSQAVHHLGLAELRGEVLRANLDPDSSALAAGLDMPDFWRHCISVAVAARTIAQRANLPLDLQEVYTCGLLHDVGKLAMALAMPKSYARVAAARGGGRTSRQIEHELLGFDHAVLGRRLCGLWRLPMPIQEVAWLHPHNPNTLPATVDRRLVMTVTLADHLTGVAQDGPGAGRLTGLEVETICRELGLSGDDLSAIEQALPGIVRELWRQAAAEPADGNGETVAAAATRELLRVHAELVSQAAAAEASIKAMECLRAFTANMDAQVTTSQLLLEIARTAARALSGKPVTPVIAYAMDSAPEPGDTLAACLAGDAHSFRTLPRIRVELPPPSPPGPADAAMAPVLADEHELSDWADLAACEHRALVCAGRWVGGIIYPRTAAAPAAQHALAALCDTMAMALCLVQDRSRAMLIGEQLAGASQVLAEASEALAETRTLAAIGEMAAGAAHELNNPLAVISGRAQMMRLKAATPEDRKIWQTMAQQAQRLSDIITELMEFASPAPPSPQAFDVREMLKQAADAFSSSSHVQAATAVVDIDMDACSGTACADAAQMQAVVQELIANAANAAADVSHIYLSAAADAASRTVLITVADDGPGMDQQTLARAFTPFFSAQRAGRRRGLGLPRARRYVEINRGKIWISSAPGQGAKVFVLLPMARS